jgi:hypothetical protein
MPGALAPRPLPKGNAPLIYGSVVVGGALPLFLIFGWPLTGWAIAAVLWVAGQLVARVLQRQPIGMGNLASSGAVAMGRMVRTITAGVVLVAVTVTNQSVGVAALAVYAIAYSVEFATSLATYYGGEAKT